MYRYVRCVLAPLFLSLSPSGLWDCTYIPCAALDVHIHPYIYGIPSLAHTFEAHLLVAYYSKEGKKSLRPELTYSSLNPLDKLTRPLRPSSTCISEA